MGSYFVVLVVAALATATLMPLLMSLAARVGALDDTQTPPIPRAGGWGLALGCGASLVLVGMVFHPTGVTLLGTSQSIGAVAIGAGAILILGTIDDVRPLRPRLKFLIQAAIALGVYLLGVRVQLVSSPFGGLELGSLVSAVLTVVWLVGISNAFNLLDGADGIAAGSAFFAAAAIFIVSITLGHPAIGLVTAALAGALLGFLPFNFPPARAYLGDAGSLFAGFLLAGLAVEGSTKGATLVVIGVPVLAFGVPVLDTTITLVRRLVRGQSMFQRDYDHVHHHLFKAGLSARQVVGVVYTASIAFALAAMLFINPSQRSYGLGLIILAAGVWMIVRYLRLHELNELARLARRGAQQARAIPMNVQLRRGVDRLRRAETIEDLEEGLAILMRRSEFDEVVLIAAPVTERRGNARAWRLVDGKFVEQWPRRSADEWEVVCPFEGDGWSAELHLRRRLGKRSLLLDFNLLLELVQPALANAAQRIPATAVLKR
jgi:UDP-GlcNAc:undecaprenyl-phosphate GlcNAc-1-phosphate transferase